MPRICILALIGLPAVGKTLFSRWLLALQQQHFNVVHLCYDDFLQLPSEAETTAKVSTNSQFDFKLQRLKISETLEAIVNSLNRTKSLPNDMQHKVKMTTVDSNDFVVICDDNNYYRSMRYKLYQFCRKHSLSYAQVYLECEVQQALARNAQRYPINAKVPDHVLRQMSERLEPPTNGQQLSWETSTLILNMTKSEFPPSIILPFIVSAFANIPEPVVELKPKETQTATMTHQLDILLRQRIKQLLCLESNATTKHSRAMDLNLKRKSILQKFKPEEEGEVKELSTLVDLLH